MKIKISILLTALAVLLLAGLAPVNTASADSGDVPSQTDGQQVAPLDPTSIPIAGVGESRRRDRATELKEARKYMVISIEEGVTETQGFDPTGFQGDVLAAMAQAAGLDQTSSTAVTAATTYCRTYDAWRQGNAAVGVVWRFHHSIYYCYNGTQLVGTPTSWSWASNLKPGWQYNGEISSARYWRPYPTSYYVFRQGKFQLCFSWCFQQVNPWVSWTVWGSGSAVYKTGS
jgi:hypothetical protein